MINRTAVNWRKYRDTRLPQTRLLFFQSINFFMKKERRLSPMQWLDVTKRMEQQVKLPVGVPLNFCIAKRIDRTCRELLSFEHRKNLLCETEYFSVSEVSF